MIPDRILLHLGIHKTATTYLQFLLHQNRTRLRREGIDILPLDRTREMLTWSLWDGKIETRERRQAVERVCPSQTLILSDENFLGIPRQIREGRLYATAGTHLGRLADAVPNTRFEVLLTLREYSGFLTSMYGEYLRHNPFIPANRFLPATALKRLRWTPVVEAVAEVFGPCRITLAWFEDVRMNWQPILDWFGPGLTTKAADEESPTQRRASLSKPAVERLAAIAKTESPAAAQETLRTWQRAGSTPEGPTYTPFSVRAAEAAQRRYEEEKARLQGRFAGLEKKSSVAI